MAELKNSIDVNILNIQPMKDIIHQIGIILNAKNNIPFGTISNCDASVKTLFTEVTKLEGIVVGLMEE